jgi:hypothetical protein
MAVGVAALILLGGCDWLGIGGGDSTTSTNAKVRPGAERAVAVTNSLPGARGAGQYDASVAPLDETRGAPRIGSVVQGKGGQKAQIEAATKDANERESRDREERARAEREANLKKAQEGDKAGDKTADKSGDKKIADPIPSGVPANMPPAAPPAPVTAAPIDSPPPAQPAAPPSAPKQ